MSELVIENSAISSQSSAIEATYTTLLNQIKAITAGEPDLIANMANISAVLFNNMPQINWAGFYLHKDNQLVLGPFQGQVACIRIPLGKGVCGTAALTSEVQRVEDVHAFEGHIACDAASNSEIVLPVQHNGVVIAVLDIDSPIFSRFSEHDQQFLEQVITILESTLAA